MPDHRTVSFTIAHMDSLGQGVSKESDKITFIPKTLPEERGEAEVVAQKKGVSFARLTKLTQVSPQRIDPICPHFEVCPSCHFLHTSYSEELTFKRQNLERLFQKIPHPQIKVSEAPRRTHYRNRIQLHYDLKARQLGMLDVKNHRIAPIPKCLIARPLIAEELQRLYEANSWMQLLDRHQPSQGHLEIYEKEGKVQVSVNRPYAEGGFTQVFEEMNQQLKDRLQSWSYEHAQMELLDLFAGNGNLSHQMNYSKRLCVDVYAEKVQDPFLSQDLYSTTAIGAVKKKLNQIQISPALLVLDPPRSGLKNLDTWLEEFTPQKVAYVSCDPHTLARDIMPLRNYQLTGLELLDFFPSTFHFETVAFLERK